jgi:hypothetical protein
MLKRGLATGEFRLAVPLSSERDRIRQASATRLIQTFDQASFDVASVRQLLQSMHKKNHG